VLRVTSDLACIARQDDRRKDEPARVSTFSGSILATRSTSIPVGDDSDRPLGALDRMMDAEAAAAAARLDSAPSVSNRRMPAAGRPPHGRAYDSIRN